MQEIILAILGIIGAVDLIRLFFVKQDRKQKEADTHQTNAETGNKELETAREANRLLSEQLERSHETIKSLTEENNALHEEKADLLATQACLFDDMCIHKGCSLRKPHPGQGRAWYNKYREDPSLGADYLSIHTLLKQERAARSAKEEGEDDE